MRGNSMRMDDTNNVSNSICLEFWEWQRVFIGYISKFFFFFS